MKRLLSSLAIIAVLAGCAIQTIPGDRASAVRNFIQNIEPSLKPAAAMATSIAFSAVKSTPQEQKFKSDMSKVAAIVASFTPDQTPGQLSKAIQAILPATDQNKTLADAIAGGVGIALPFARDDSALFLKCVSDIAAGILSGIPQ
jgi:hypothetical protein